MFLAILLFILSLGSTIILTLYTSEIHRSAIIHRRDHPLFPIFSYLDNWTGVQNHRGSNDTERMPRELTSLEANSVDEYRFVDRQSIYYFIFLKKLIQTQNIGPSMNSGTMVLIASFFALATVLFLSSGLFILFSHSISLGVILIASTLPLALAAMKANNFHASLLDIEDFDIFHVIFSRYYITISYGTRVFLLEYDDLIEFTHEIGRFETGLCIRTRRKGLMSTMRYPIFYYKNVRDYIDFESMASELNILLKEGRNIRGNDTSHNNE